jgi:methionyl-tRNA synthetase
VSQGYVYVTTPIYYPNDRPHLGHAYTTVLADVVSRWFSLVGYETLLLTGTDEHGLKLQREAEKRGVDPKVFVDQMSEVFKEYWRRLGIGYGRFIRTTDSDHEELVKRVLVELWRKGLIYPGVYRGWYCAACEKFYSEKEYVIVSEKPYCPIHQRPLEYVEEETYFLKLSQYRDQVLKILREGDVIYPRQYADEVASKIELEGLQDLSIARPKERVSWGIELPFDNKFTVYVWIDALLNYLTGAYFGVDEKRFENLWRNSIQFIGKDILWFHTAVWFSLLAMLGLSPPKKLVVHGFLTFRGQKMGKSLGNVTSIDDMITRYGSADAVRFIIARIANFEKDSEVSWDIYDSIYLGDLVNNYGNLVRRATSLAIKLLGGAVERDVDESHGKIVKELVEKAIEHYSSIRISEAVKTATDIAHETNAYLNREEPWAKEKPIKTIYNTLESIRLTTLLLYPVMPGITQAILKAIGVEVEKGLKQFQFGYIEKYHVRESPIPFKKLPKTQNNPPH